MECHIRQEAATGESRTEPLCRTIAARNERIAQLQLQLDEKMGELADVRRFAAPVAAAAEALDAAPRLAAALSAARAEARALRVRCGELEIVAQQQQQQQQHAPHDHAHCPQAHARAAPRLVGGAGSISEAHVSQPASFLPPDSRAHACGGTFVVSGPDGRGGVSTVLCPGPKAGAPVRPQPAHPPAKRAKAGAHAAAAPGSIDRFLTR